MQVSVYVKPEHEALFDRAQKLAGGSLSGVIADAVRLYVERAEGLRDGFEEVTLSLGPGRPVKFLGRKLVQEDNGWTAYQLPSGRIVAHSTQGLWVYDNQRQMEVESQCFDECPLPKAFVTAILTALGEEPTEWIE